MHDGEIVTRFLPLRAAKLDVSSDARLGGYALVFNSLSEDLGGFRERIAPSAVDRTLKKGSNVQALQDHQRDTKSILGDTDSGLLKLTKDRHGLAVDIRPPDTSNVRDLMTVVKAGLAKGMSFAFRVWPDGATWDEEGPDDMLVRTVTDMEIFEVSVVVNPAYSATEINARNHEIDMRSLQAFKQSVGWKPSLRMRERIARLHV